MVVASKHGSALGGAYKTKLQNLRKPPAHFGERMRMWESFIERALFRNRVGRALVTC